MDAVPASSPVPPRAAACSGEGLLGDDSADAIGAGDDETGDVEGICESVPVMAGVAGVATVVAAAGTEEQKLVPARAVVVGAAVEHVEQGVEAGRWVGKKELMSTTS